MEDAQEKSSTLNVDGAAEGRTMLRKSDAQLVVMEVQLRSGDTRGKLRVLIGKDFVNSVVFYGSIVF
ncbi:MAG: hypothetical protein AOA66_0052 [Candidatus Bathyarchaeota archaeon BA2]|nr:MAG: hypothetical protein AOA66_0052 [Candidatus Bathyarchaeota archaeon BA2]